MIGFLSQSAWEFVTLAFLAWDFVTLLGFSAGNLSRTYWGFVTFLLGVCHVIGILFIVFQRVRCAPMLIFR